MNMSKILISNRQAKRKFDLIIQLHNTHQWRSLCLSNSDATPGQIESFCQLFPLAQSH